MKVFYYTSRGLLPHVSQIKVNSVNVSLPHVYSLNSLLNNIDLQTYLGLQDTETLLSIKDTLQSKSVSGSSNVERIRVTSPQELSLSIEDYMHFAVKTGFKKVVSFAEEAAVGTGNHRSVRSAKQAMEMVGKCLEMKSESMEIFGNIQGGKLVEQRVRCAQHMKTTTVDGKLHLGFYIGAFYQDDDPKLIKEITRSVCEVLKTDPRPIMLSGEGNLIDIILGALQGVTYFECAHPFIVAKAGVAMLLNVSNLPTSLSGITEFDLNLDYSEQQLDLHALSYKTDTEPISSGCKCYTCQHHARAYLHHLVTCEELTGIALITLCHLSRHNVHVIQELIRILELAKATNQFRQYCLWLIGAHMQCNTS